ncbi:hypothetical protein FMUND_15809 [Fusarium mundagurra]|uniref:Uncharacterized protein n=1 Tax=Fusarium mundagurra TaxID=1567541 RepID=A0A8H6CXU7_9HYPO|nr:hypothetical protein FMUND_15809 [Fusarium mundagurra]
MDEIRRHNLAMLLPASSTTPSQELNDGEDCSNGNSEVSEDSNIDERISCIETASASEETSHEKGTEDTYEKQDPVAPEVLDKEPAANESQASTRKRMLDDDETTMPLAKRLRTWIAGVFASRTAWWFESQHGKEVGLLVQCYAEY